MGFLHVFRQSARPFTYTVLFQNKGIKNNQGPSDDGNYAGVVQSGFSLAFSNTRAEIWEDSTVEHGLGVT